MSFKNIKIVAISVSGFLLSTITLCTFATDINSINNIFDSVDFIKESIGLEGITIDSKIPYNLIQGVVQKFCPQSAVDQATLELGKFNNILKSDLNNSNKYLSDKFDTVKGLIINQKEDNQFKFCKNNFLLFSMLKSTQDLYLGENTLEKRDTKEANNHNVDDSFEDTNQLQKNSGVSNTQFTFIHDTSGLPDNVKKSYSESTEIYLQEILASLLDNDILNRNDLKIFENKIYITYKQSCNFTEGAFRVVKDLNTEACTFKDINLIIAYCDKDDSPERQKRHVQQILAHELGHYIYFFKDNHSSIFSKICWNNNKSICKSEGFVSDYAKESSEEDYADSFAYRYLDSHNGDYKKQHNNISKNPLGKKFKYFELSFG